MRLIRHFFQVFFNFILFFSVLLNFQRRSFFYFFENTQRKPCDIKLKRCDHEITKKLSVQNLVFDSILVFFEEISNGF